MSLFHITLPGGESSAVNCRDMPRLANWETWSPLCGDEKQIICSGAELGEGRSILKSLQQLELSHSRVDIDPELNIFNSHPADTWICVTSTTQTFPHWFINLWKLSLIKKLLPTNSPSQSDLLPFQPTDSSTNISVSLKCLCSIFSWALSAVK